jgi:hypothetical protein
VTIDSHASKGLQRHLGFSVPSSSTSMQTSRTASMTLSI